MSERKTISKTLRFEVFKRDSFTCQYCGRSAPDVILEVDHIVPVAEGGQNEIMNLVTSCRDCNRGKGKRELSDDTILKKQKAQLDDLNERREQLEMMVAWKQGLAQIMQSQVEAIEQLFYHAYGREFTETGWKQMRNLIRKYGFDEVYTSTEIAIDKYPADVAFDKIGGICYNRAHNVTYDVWRKKRYDEWDE